MKAPLQAEEVAAAVAAGPAGGGDGAAPRAAAPGAAAPAAATAALGGGACAAFEESRENVHASAATFAVRGAAAVPGFAALQADSLKATSLEHGMQYSSIYWETGHRTYLPFWASLTQKFSWKIIDDQLRSLLRLPAAVTAEPFVFASAQPYIRRYYGDADIAMAFPLRAAGRFAFVPTATARPWEEEKLLRDLGVQAAVRRGTAATTFRAVLESAWKCDMDDALSRYMRQQQQQLQQQQQR